MARVIVIDDDEQIRGFLQRLLEHAGHLVATAGNGDEGIELHQQEHADLIVTDILMPVQGGIETIYELRRASPDVKIIAISGGGAYGAPNHYMELARKIGAHSAFTKPFDSKALLDTVGELLANSQSSIKEQTYS